MVTAMSSSSKNTDKKLAKLIASAIFGALLTVLQIAFSPLPNIEPVTVLLLVFGCVLGKYAFISLGVFIAAEGLIFGFGIWWISYLYIWIIPVVAAMLFKNVKSFLPFTAFSALFGLLFGTLGAIPYLFIGGFAYTVSYIAAGIPFDIIHCVSNAVMTAILFTPLRKLLEKLEAKHL